MPTPDDDLLLAPWTGARGGVPPFARVAPAALEPALRAAMDLQRRELDAIAGAEDAPTFENTVAALEDSGRALARVSRLIGVFAATLNDAEMQAVEARVAPVLAAFADELVQREALFRRIDAVHRGLGAPPAPGQPALTAEQRRLVETVHRAFARAGAALGAPAKARLAELNQRLASLYTTFGQRALADEEGEALLLADEADLAGLPASARAAARQDAAARGLEGWRIANTRSSIEPFLTFAARRDLRERAWRMFVRRGDLPGPNDNKPVIAEILRLRAERARLLGYPSHAHWALDDAMARTPEAAAALLARVWGPAVARAREELAELQALADAEGAGVAIAPWDHRYYAERVRRARYDLDQEELGDYLQLDRLREAMFWVAGELYGLAFAPAPDAPGYHPDVAAWEVTRGGARVGLWYFDPYARDGKRSGAWMEELRTQEAFRGAVTPIVTNNANFLRGAPGAPVRVSWDDAVTMFHEFGHALHGLLSAVRYPSLAGTNTKRDFVEFPSQLHERWLTAPEVLGRFLRHHRTGAPMPAALVERLAAARLAGQGFKTVEYLAAAIYDLEIHRAEAPPEDPAAFEAALLARIGCPDEIGMRHRPTHFGHVFAGDGYAAGYYSYLWADTLTADAAEAFVEAGSYFDPATARRLHDAVLAVGNAVPPEEAFRAFRGRDVDPDALMRDRGFPVAG